MPHHDVLWIHCQCCQLRQSLSDRDGAIPTICDKCQPHQGKLLDKRLARAEAHEKMLRERLDACRASEKRAQERHERDKEKAASALRSRGSLAARIVGAAEEAGTHKCASVMVARDPEVVKMADRHRRGHYDEDDW